MLSDYLNWVGNFVEEWGYVAVFLGMMLENVVGLGLIFPGLFILIMGGYYAGVGNLNLISTLVSGYFGVLVGDNISYAFGRYGLIKISILKRLSPRLRLIEESIRGNTEKFLFFFHFPVYSRMILPTFLGILKFNVWRWLILDSFGALLFSATFSVVGYIIGKTANTLDVAINTSNYIQWAFFILFAWWLFSVIRAIKKFLATNEDES
ncbi:MAG: hypothetical protein KDD94_08035 [Calditrichaeota bacterium]|nr:hypothetical protein [Calditrichota bacterium]